jgi:hypothetical protein
MVPYLYSAVGDNGSGILALDLTNQCCKKATVSSVCGFWGKNERGYGV